MRAVLVACVSLLAVAPTAQAATATFAQVPCSTTTTGFCPEVHVTEDPASPERNQVAVERTIAGLRISDRATALRAAGGCSQTSPNTVTCPSEALVIDLGALDDELDESLSGTIVRLGAGNDRCHCSGEVHGGPGDDRVRGRATQDVLAGGSGSDRIEGQGGDDRLVADDRDGSGPTESEVPAADVVSGGTGSDTVSYENRYVAPVSVDLARRGGDQGATAEGDRYTSIENVRGSRRSDRIRGDRRANVLEGARGHDLVDGVGGNDRIEGAMLRGQLAAGDRDRLRGGSGRDRIVAAGNGTRMDGGPDNDLLEVLKPVTRATVRCGRGRDVFQTNGQRFRGGVASDCEIRR